MKLSIFQIGFGLVLMTFLGGNFSLAAGKNPKTPVKRKGHHHEHGKATINIAIQGNRGKIELKIPVESLVGFENKPKSAKEIAAYDNAMTMLSSDISKIVRFDDKLSCDIKKEMVERTQDTEKGAGHTDTEHSDINVDYNFGCQGPLEGTSIILDFSQSFKRVKKAEVSVVSGTLQKSAEYSGQAITIELK